MYVGGLIGQISGGSVVDSYATGDVTAGGTGTGTCAGGLAGYNGSSIYRSFATGRVTGNSAGFAGGLDGCSPGATFNSYATGPVTVGATGFAGGLVGFLTTANGTIVKSFSVGKVVGPAGHVGGLLAKQTVTVGPVSQSYWDVNTSGQAASIAGTAKTTAQLRAALPPGLTSPLWGITPTVTYPFLAQPNMFFWSTLATTVKTARAFVSVPIVEREAVEYASAVAHADKASEAAAYTMIARAIGVTKGIAGLQAEKIDTDFWHDATQTTTWAGPVTAHVTRGAVIALAAGTAITLGNIAGQLKANNLVVISGPSGIGTIYMLATSYMVNAGGAITALIANDPYTGRQVRINPTTKKVVSPAGFPFPGFSVTAYRVMTIL